MLDFVLNDRVIQQWLNKADMEKLYDYVKYATADFLAAAALATFDWLDTPPLVPGTPRNVLITNIREGKLAATSEQYLLTSMQMALGSPTAATSHGVLADATNEADARRLIHWTYLLSLKTSGGSEIAQIPMVAMPEGLGMHGQISTGGFSSWGVPDLGDALPVVYCFSHDVGLSENMQALGTDYTAVTPVVPTIPVGLRGKLLHHGVRFRTDKRG